MQRWCSTLLVFLLFGVITGCSGSISPITPDDSLRFGSYWPSGQKWVLWDTQMPSNQYKNIDLSVLVDGAGLTNVDFPSSVNDRPVVASYSSVIRT